MALFAHLSWFFREHWRTYLLALLMLAGVAVLNMAVPWLIGRAVDQLVSSGAQPRSGSDNDISGYLLALLILGLCVYGLRYGWRLILFGTSYQLGNRLRARFYQRLCRQGAAFYGRHGTGDLMARATNDIDAIELAAGEGVLSGFDGLLTFLLVLIMMFAVIDWRLALVALIPFPFMALGFYRISRAVHHHFQRALELFSALNDRTQQTLSGIHLVRAMGRETTESLAFSAIAEKASDSNYRVARSEALYDPVIFLCLSAALLLTLGYGALLIWQQQLSVGQLTSFTMYLGQLIWPMFAFGWLLNIVERGSAAFTRVEELLTTADSIEDKGRQRPAGIDIRVRELCFSYPDATTPALEGISFDLTAGQTLGIAGPTGAGKSTLVQLLMRHWQSPPGQIRLDDRPLDQWQLQALRAGFAWVPQEAFLFSLSIAENIALFRPEASAEEIQAAATAACVHEDIQAFPAGYRTRVGERGVTLSGGQRQRIAIARALVSRAPILILDDALSAVDIHTERNILDHLRQQLDQPTDEIQRSCIIISHRLSAVELSDQILVLSHGQLQQKGNHKALISEDGWYARMWTYQQMETTLLEELR